MLLFHEGTRDMITVVHWMKGKRHRRYAYELVDGKAQWPEEAKASAYACGMKRPNYPVPATLFRGYQDIVSPVNQYWTPFGTESGIY